MRRYRYGVRCCAWSNVMRRGWWVMIMMVPGTCFWRIMVRLRLSSVLLQMLHMIHTLLIYIRAMGCMVSVLKAWARLQTMWYSWTWGNESLLTVTILTIIQAVTAGTTTRVLSMLRHRVLWRLAIYFWHACSDYLITPILFLAEGQWRLRYQTRHLALRIAKLRLAFENCRWSYLLNLNNWGFNCLWFRVFITLAHVDRLRDMCIVWMASRRRRLLGQPYT